MSAGAERSPIPLSPIRIVVQVKGSARSFKEAVGSFQKKKQVTPAAHRNSNWPCIDRVVSA